MNHDSYSDAYIRDILDDVKTVALVGASNNPTRASFLVLKYLIAKGYDLYPINPGQAGKDMLGRTVYASLSDVPVSIDMIDIFRNSEAAGKVIDEALRLDPLPKVVWMQLTVRNDDAAERAEQAGIRVVMNRCPKIEYGRLSGEIGWTGVNSKTISAKRPKLAKGFQHLNLREKPGGKPK